MEFPSFHLSGRLHFARRRAPCALLTDQARHVLHVARVASRNAQTGRGDTCWEICGPGKAAQWVENQNGEAALVQPVRNTERSGAGQVHSAANQAAQKTPHHHITTSLSDISRSSMGKPMQALAGDWYQQFVFSSRWTYEIKKVESQEDSQRLV